MVRTGALKRVLRLIRQAGAKGAVSRREILRTGLTATTLLPLATVASRQAIADSIGAALRAGPGADPVAIIGAGVAGLTAAYRLTSAGVPCRIYEASERVGGRMFTRRNFNADGMFCELGGELVDTGHKDLIALCGELGIGLEDLTAGDAGIEREAFYIGGQLRFDQDLLQAFAPLAEIVARDTAILLDSDGDIQTPTWNKSLGAEGLDQMSLAEYLDSLRGAVDAWVLKLLEVLYVCEYGRSADEQSSLNFLLMLSPDTSDGIKLLGDSDESKRIQGGSQRLPLTLAETLSPSTPIRFGHELVFVRDNGSRIDLGFSTDGSGRASRVTSASRVIFALPFSILRSVDGIGSLELDSAMGPILQRSVSEIGYGTNAKLMMSFDQRTWRLPTQSRPAMNGAVVSDLKTQQIWETSRAQPGNRGILTCYMGGSEGARPGSNKLQATLDDIGQFFGEDARANFDGQSVMQIWARSPYVRGSYICPLPGQYTTLMGISWEAGLSNRIFFCGEHTSVDFQGFMNGAVQSANRVAKQILGQKTLINPANSLNFSWNNRIAD